VSLLETKVDNLADYGITTQQIDDLKNSFDRFLQMSGQPRQYRVASSVATQTLDELFKQVTELLEEKLDKVMSRFKSSHPAFYIGYNAARIVVD
jgi:hypothetical protein